MNKNCFVKFKSTFYNNWFIGYYLVDRGNTGATGPTGEIGQPGVPGISGRGGGTGSRGPPGLPGKYSNLMHQSVLCCCKRGDTEWATLGILTKYVSPNLKILTKKTHLSKPWDSKEIHFCNSEILRKYISPTLRFWVNTFFQPWGFR